MYKLMIVDDNPWIREDLSTILDWQGMGISIVCTCANGKQALQKIMEWSPDIVLTDIAMPVMNGIELAEAVKNDMPDVKVIFMSSYNEFEFAKSAIDLDIYGYVLKPIEPGQLQQVIKKVLDVCSEEYMLQSDISEMKKQLNDSLPLLQEQFLKELLFGMFVEHEDIVKRTQYLKFQLGEVCSIVVITVEINEYENLIRDKSIEDNYYIIYSMKKLIHSYNTDSLRIFTTQTSVKEISAILFFTSPDCNGEDREVLDIAVDIREDIFQKLGISTTLGISNMMADFIDIPKLYQQSVKAINTRFYGDGTQIINYKEIALIQEELLDGEIDMQFLYKTLKELISYGSEGEIKGFVSKYLAQTLQSLKRAILRWFHF